MNLYILNNSCSTELVKYLMNDKSDTYKVLSKKEEKELIEKLRDNREELNRQLVNHNIRLVFSMSKKYAKSAEDFDDLIMNGIYGLCQAACKFDINVDNKFCTYATWWIRKYMLAPYYDHYNTDIKNLSVELNANIHTPNNSTGEKPTYLDIISSKIEPTYKASDLEDGINHDLNEFDYKTIVNAVSSEVDVTTELSSLDKNVYLEYFVNNKTIKEISSSLDVDSKLVYTAKKRVKSFVKSFLKKKYNIVEFADI